MDLLGGEPFVFLAPQCSIDVWTVFRQAIPPGCTRWFQARVIVLKSNTRPRRRIWSAPTRWLVVAFIAFAAWSGGTPWQRTPHPSPPRANPLDSGPGGPILVILDPNRPFGSYLCEILRNEGLNAFRSIPIGEVTADLLRTYRVVILSRTDMSVEHVDILDGWVRDGGNLIAMQPRAQLLRTMGLATTNVREFPWVSSIAQISNALQASSKRSIATRSSPARRNAFLPVADPQTMDFPPASDSCRRRSLAHSSLAAGAISSFSFASLLAASLPESAALASVSATIPLIWLASRAGRRF